MLLYLSMAALALAVNTCSFSIDIWNPTQLCAGNCDPTPMNVDEKDKGTLRRALSSLPAHLQPYFPIPGNSGYGMRRRYKAAQAYGTWMWGTECKFDFNHGCSCAIVTSTIIFEEFRWVTVHGAVATPITPATVVPGQPCPLCGRVDPGNAVARPEGIPEGMEVWRPRAEQLPLDLGPVTGRHDDYLRLLKATQPCESGEPSSYVLSDGSYNPTCCGKPRTWCDHCHCGRTECCASETQGALGDAQNHVQEWHNAVENAAQDAQDHVHSHIDKVVESVKIPDLSGWGRRRLSKAEERQLDHLAQLVLEEEEAALEAIELE